MTKPELPASELMARRLRAMAAGKKEEAPPARGAHTEENELHRDDEGHAVVQGHAEPRRLLAAGFKLCKLLPMQKRPEGNGWQLNPVTEIEDSAGGYGVLLDANGLGSIDPDNLKPAREGLARCGFDLELLMQAGARTSSTRPGSGGRSTFKVPKGLGRVKFSSHIYGTILELRAGQSNLQDCLPGTVYFDKHGNGPYRQEYANGKTLDNAPDLPADFLAWWQRMDTDLVFLREQQELFCGEDAMLAISGGEGKGEKLAFSSIHRRDFNAANDVEAILGEHGYTNDGGARWAPASATGAACVRRIPGRDGLWQSDHASDPLCGTFDAWTAHVVLVHRGDVKAAEKAWLPRRQRLIAEEFDIQTPAQVEQLVEAERLVAETVIKAKSLRFVPQPLGTFLNRPTARWHVKNLVPQAELVMVYGPSGAGKSFWLFDVVASIARGQPWCGRKVRPGRVAYVVAEGAGGFVSRVGAYLKHQNIDPSDLDLEIVPAAPNLTGKDADALLLGLKSRGEFDIVVIDTLSATAAGANENSSEMNPVLQACKRIHAEMGATVILVHHTGKDVERGARGWSGLKAAMDAEIEIVRTDKQRAARVTKLKDGSDEQPPMFFHLESVHLGSDEDGEPITSCVVAHDGYVPEVVDVKGKRQRAVVEEFQRLADFGAVTLTALVEACAPKWPQREGAKTDRRKDYARDTVRSMITDGVFVELGAHVQLKSAASNDQYDLA